MVMEVVEEDIEGLGMSCNEHPYKTQTAGGICAFCLQDKLGKLVSSSFPSAIFPATSSISSPSSNDHGATNAVKNTPRESFLGKSRDAGIVFQRSKSTAAGNRTRGFWSFLARDGTRLSGIGSSFRHRSLRERRDRESGGDCGGGDERKVSRSRSVGCGSRSFSGDFFERLSTGLGDCALRRVESQREGKPKNTPVHGGPGDRVRCGGIFGSFSSLSATNSSSSSSSATNHSQAPPVPVAALAARHGRSRSWGWALASPMRAFSSSKTKRESGGRKPNLNAIPSILAVGG